MLLQSAFKLLCAGAAFLGPFSAGVLYHYVRDAEIYAIFLTGGVLLGFAGLCGYAAIDRSEWLEHERHLGRRR